jgi:hypothetical protein
MLAYTSEHDDGQQAKRHADAVPDVGRLHAHCLCRCARLGEVYEGLDEEGYARYLTRPAKV